MYTCIHVYVNLHDGPHHTSDVPALCTYQAHICTHMMYSHIIIFLILCLAQVLARGGCSVLQIPQHLINSFMGKFLTIESNVLMRISQSD